MTTETPNVDSLTGLHTRDAFAEALDQALARANTLTLGVIESVKEPDMERLTRTYGREMGDGLLLGVTERLRPLAQQCDGFAARSFRTFWVALPGVAVEASARQLEGLRAQVAADSAAILPGVPDLHLSMSVGVANYPRDARTGPDLLKRADHALWEAKDAGEDRVVLAWPDEMAPKECYYAVRRLDQLKQLAAAKNVRQSDLLREALDDFLSTASAT